MLSTTDRLRPLRAGSVTLLLDGGDLRYVRIGGTELLRRVYVAVRDADWRTVAGSLSNQQVEEERDAFRVEFDCRNIGAGVDLAWHGTISGDATGRLEYVFDARALTETRFARIGICLHHPWRETAGARYRAHSRAGEIHGVFPDLIGVQRFADGYFHAIFDPFDRLDVELARGGSVGFEFEGDLWEVEDHRNWTDANFKTYSTPLGLGPPAPLAAGEPLRQRVVVTPVAVPAEPRRDGAVRVAVGDPTGARVPQVGLGADRDHHRLDETETRLLRALAPGHVRVELRLDRDGWPERLAAAQAAAGELGAPLELVLLLREGDVPAVADVARAVAAGPPVARVLVCAAGARPGRPGEVTPPELLARARDALAPALPGVPFLGGTEMYFAELNRGRPQAAGWDGVCFSISPQVHAFTDLDLVENLDAQAETVRSARALAGGKSVVISPITLLPRENFYGADRDAVPAAPPDRLPPSVDPRQASLFGAAWTVGSLKYAAEAGADAVTYYTCSGWEGVVERAAGAPLPELFRSGPHTAYPLYHPLADACEWAGARVLSCASSDPLACAGLAVLRDDGALHVLLANLTPRPLEVELDGIGGRRRLRRLGEEAVLDAGAEPEAYRTRFEDAGPAALALSPYEVVRLDVTQPA